MIPLALVSALAAVAPHAEGMMRPHLQALGGRRRGASRRTSSPRARAPPRAGIGGFRGVITGLEAGQRRTCAPQFDDLRPGSADPLAFLSAQERLGSDLLERGRGSQQNRSLVRPCIDSTTTIPPPLVLPKYKLAFLYIQKVGCTDFKDLFNAINGLEEAVGFGDFYSYAASAYFLQGVDLEDLTKENGWKFAAFTRDPALRYLSAYGDTCTVENMTATLGLHQWSCCGELVSVDSPLEAQAEHFSQRLRMDAEMGRPEDDQHWAQQTEVLASCGASGFAPEHLDYWGILSGDVHSQVKEMLQIVGFQDDALVERFFPKDHAAGHHGLLKGEPSDYIRDLDTLEAIIRLYEDDYRAFPGIGCAFTEPLLAKLQAANASGT